MYQDSTTQKALNKIGIGHVLCSVHKTLFTEIAFTVINFSGIIFLQHSSIHKITADPNEMAMDTYSVLHPFVLIMKIFGLLPLKVFQNRKKKESSSQKVKSFLVVGICLLIMIGIICVNLLRERIEIDYSTVLPKAWEASLMLGLLNLPIVYFYQHSKVTEIATFLKLLESFDMKVDFAS